MKRTNFRSFISGVLVTLFCVGLIGSAAATVGQRTLTASYSDIKVFLDGRQVDLRDATGAAVEPFAVNGTTYLPVRAVGEALGLSVAWDGDTSSVLLTSPKADTVAPSLPPLRTPSTPATDSTSWMDELSESDRYDVTFAFLRSWVQTEQNATMDYPTYTEERARADGGVDIFYLSYVEERNEIALTLSTLYDKATYISYIGFSGEGLSDTICAHFVAHCPPSSSVASADGYGLIDAPDFGPDSSYGFYLYSGNNDLQADYENLSKWMCLSSLDFLNYIFDAKISQYGPYSLSSLGFNLASLGLS